MKTQQTPPDLIFFYSILRQHCKQPTRTKITNLARVISKNSRINQQHFLKISVVFENRNRKRSNCHTSFFNARNGSEAFLYTPPEPYATMRLFACFNWNQQSQFLNNININAEFTEVPV